jgi:UDP-glucuronate 4-epimerase
VIHPDRVLVTGAAGFIGSTLVDRLLGEGREVVGYDSFDPFYPEEQKRRNLEGALRSASFRLERGDIRDAAAVGRLFADGGFRAVVHLAALAGVRPSLERPAVYADVNVHGTAVLLQAAAEHGVPHSDPVERPISPYAATKRAGELVAHTFHHAHGLSVTCARIFTVYGPRQRPDLAIRKFAERMQRGEKVPIYGDGQSLRDFTFVDDLVDGLVRALDRDLGFAILNLGAGRQVSVLEVVKLLEQELGLTAELEWLPAQLGDVRRTWADIEAAREALGYAPRTSFEEGIGRFAEWLGKKT